MFVKSARAFNVTAAVSSHYVVFGVGHNARTCSPRADSTGCKLHGGVLEITIGYAKSDHDRLSNKYSGLHAAYRYIMQLISYSESPSGIEQVHICVFHPSHTPPNSVFT